MQTHTTIGAEVLQKVARKQGFARPFLQMAIDIARHLCIEITESVALHDLSNTRQFIDGIRKYGAKLSLAKRAAMQPRLCCAKRSSGVSPELPTYTHGLSGR